MELLGNYCKFNVDVCRNAKNDVEVGTGTRPLIEVNTHHAERVEDPSHRRNVSFDSTVTVFDDTSFTPQSGTTSDHMLMKQVTAAKYQNVAFTEQHEPYLYDTESVIDPTRKVQDSSDATLQNFFSRPIKVAEYQWNVGTSLFQQFNPWELFYENPRVINRICNYNLLRSKLKVKFVINGSGFHYGRAIASYLPFATFDDLSTNSANIATVVQASQQPHVYLNPTLSLGGEITLPFFWYNNWMSVVNQDWENMGSMTLRSINPLFHANGAADRCTISVFAWAEDVELSVLTSREPTALVAQSGTEQDEANRLGVVSGPATTVAAMASSAKNIHMISPFAKATEIGATAVADVAKLFGLSRPIVTKDPEPYKPTIVSSLATTTTPDGANKLTIDDKQELTIDPRIAGIGGVDSLNILEIAKRESYIGTFDWQEGTAPESLLVSLRVDPCIWMNSFGGSSPAYHFPATAAAAFPFKYWTGSLRFRFQIVCSAFHKGRIKIVYDPNSVNSNEYNTMYTQIVDLADRTDFTVEVGNGQSRTLLEHATIGDVIHADMFSTLALGNATYGNGTLNVYVVNELTSPTASNDISVNVFLSAGEDFEVFVPDSDFQKMVFQPQSGFEAQSGLVQNGPDSGVAPESWNATEESAPQQAHADALGPSLNIDHRLNLVYTGEKIASFRQLLKRYNLHSSIGFINSADKNLVLTGRRPMFPYLRGAVAGAVDLGLDGVTPFSYNFCNTVMLHWITYAFAGWRGSTRWKLVPVGKTFSDTRIEVSRAPISGSAYDDDTILLSVPTNSSQAAARVMVNDGAFGVPSATAPLSGARGLAIAHAAVNPSLEFEMPYYSPYRFSPAKREDRTTAYIEESWDFRIYARAAVDFTYNAYVAAGEDFQCYFWTGLPPLYYEPVPPDPA